MFVATCYASLSSQREEACTVGNMEGRRVNVSTHVECGSAEATAEGLRRCGVQAVVVPLDDVSTVGAEQLGGEMVWMVRVRWEDLPRARTLEEEFLREGRIRKHADGTFEFVE